MQLWKWTAGTVVILVVVFLVLRTPLGPALRIDPLHDVRPTTIGARAVLESRLLDEVSGLVRVPGVPLRFWMLNDSGNPPEIFGADSAGRVLQRVALDGASNRDWEALAIGPCARGVCLVVGDVGDNRSTRPWVTLYRVTLPLPGADRTEAERLDVRWPRGADDVEAMTQDAEGTLWFVSKGRAASRQRLMRVPSRSWASHGCAATGPTPCGQGPVTAELVQTLTLPVRSGQDFITGASYWPERRLMALRTYHDLLIVPMDRTGRLQEARGVRCRLPALQPQGEAVAWLSDGRVALATERAGGEPASLLLLGCPLP